MSLVKRWPALALLFSSAAAVCPASPVQGQEAFNTIFLVRHAEKVRDESADPPLSPAGRRRAVSLADMLEDAGITHIHSTDFRRTRETAEPLAERLGLAVETYDGGGLSDFARRLKELPGRHLVSGHSNTTHELVDLLGGEPGTPIVEDGENDRLYILTRQPDGRVNTVLLRFGERFAGREIAGTEPSSARAPAVAGTYYPSDPSKLAGVVRGLLDAAEVPAFAEEPVGRIRAGIVPHAALQFSGPIAARFYRHLEGRSYEAIIILAPSHRRIYGGATIWPGEGLTTPLGTVPIHRDLADRIVAVDDSVRYSVAGYGQEHSLEVQLPFLQTVQPDVPVVPIMVGSQSLGLSYQLARTLTAVTSNRNVLLLATSDLSHFHSAEEARWLDAELLDLVRANDPFLLAYQVFTGRLEACGVSGMATVMETGRRLGAGSPRIMAYSHSGEATGDTERVVGYASSAIMMDRGDQEDLTAHDRSLLLQVARQSLEASVRQEPLPAFPALTPILTRKQAAFVTIRKDDVLRGCVGGIFANKQLAIQVRESAVGAALRDERFPPVLPHELPALEYEISLLSPLHPLEDPEEIVIGRDGLFLVSGSRTGVLLPQVAEDAGWDRSEFLQQICIKAGLLPNAWQEPTTLVFVFSSTHFR
jgi:AmmeMemoRadiSam system protein B/AmmeMemoRadiSam system protein A